ncbi:hypothetical protein [Proteus faecis]|uniref:hypothetical protein n=1 Tax=Proteus faecis TaxID=2050967 RepID=UPI00301B7659
MSYFKSVTESFVSTFSLKLSKNKQKESEKLIAKGVKSCVAIGLLSAGKCSYPEAIVMSTIIGWFNDIGIYSYTEKPMSVCFSARTNNGYHLLIYPQYRLAKPKYLNNQGRNQQDYWFVDLAIEFLVYDKEDCESVIIGIWGLEYDGHPIHFVEGGIKSSQTRDLVIDTEYGISLKHIHKELWSENENLVKANLHAFIYRLYTSTALLPFEALRNKKVNLEKLPTLDLIESSDGVFRATHWLNNEDFMN